MFSCWTQINWPIKRKPDVHCDVLAANIWNCGGVAADCESEQSTVTAKDTVRLAASWSSDDLRSVLVACSRDDKAVITKRKYYLNTTRQFFLWCFGFYERPSSEEACSVLLPVLAIIEMWRGKKSVVRVAQHVAGLVPVRPLSNMYCFFDPSSTSVQFCV